MYHTEATDRVFQKTLHKNLDKEEATNHFPRLRRRRGDISVCSPKPHPYTWIQPRAPPALAYTANTHIQMNSHSTLVTGNRSARSNTDYENLIYVQFQLTLLTNLQFPLSDHNPPLHPPQQSTFKLVWRLKGIPTFRKLALILQAVY